MLWFVNCVTDLISILVLLEPVIFWLWIRGVLKENVTFAEVYKLGCLGIVTAFVCTCLLTSPLIAPQLEQGLNNFDPQLEQGFSDPSTISYVCFPIAILISGITVSIIAATKLSVIFASAISIGIKFSLVHLCFQTAFYLGKWLELIKLC